MGGLGSDDIRGDRRGQQQQDDEIGPVVPALGEMGNTVSEIPNEAIWVETYRSSATRNAMNI